MCHRLGVLRGGEDVGAFVVHLPFGFHSFANRWASAIWAGVSCLASASRQVSISFRNSLSMVAVPRLRPVTAYLSKDPLSTASFVKMEAISSH